MKFIKQSKTGSASSGPLWFALNTTSSQAVKGSVGPALDDGGGGIEGGGGLGGGGGDVTPNAANWIDLDWSPMNPFGYPPNNSAQITGIDSTIQIRLRDTTVFGSAPTVKYKINASAMAVNDWATGGANWITLTFTGTAGNRVSNAVTVSNNQYIGFVVTVGTTDNQYTFEVQNVSSSNAVLDSFYYLEWT